MSRHVDLVIVGVTPAACAAAIDAARRRRRVLIVSDTPANRCHRHLLRGLKAHREVQRELVSVLTGVEVVCVDGTNAIEVVLLRTMKTGRMVGINTAAVLVTTPLPPTVLSPAVRPHVQHLHSA